MKPPMKQVKRATVEANLSSKNIDCQRRLCNSLGQAKRRPFAWRDFWRVVDCVKAIRQGGTKCEEILLRALLELFQDITRKIPAKKLFDFDSYRNLEKIKRCSNEELRVSRWLLEKIRSPKGYVKLEQQKAFQTVSGESGMAYNPFVDEDASDAYFDFEQAMFLDFKGKTSARIEDDDLRAFAIIRSNAT